MLAALTLFALIAPWLAPYDAGDAFRGFLHAPPMRPHLDGLSPVVHPLVLADRLEQRFEPDRSRTVRLPWVERDHDAPVFLLGADDFGRDVLSRLLYGARTSIGLALVATLGAVLIGALAGAWAGYRGGWVDDAIMRVADFVLVLPVIYVVLVLRAVLPLVLPAVNGVPARRRGSSSPSAGRSSPRACARSSRSNAIASTCRRRNRSAPVRFASSPCI